MVFVMIKTIKGNEYAYLYECIWEDGRPRNKYISYLGRAEGFKGISPNNILQRGNINIDSMGFAIKYQGIPVEDIEYKEVYPVAHKQRANKYAKLMEKGEIFPPIEVFGKRTEKDKYQVFDGHARVLAHRILKKKTIDAKIALVNEKGQSRKYKNLLVKKS